MNNFADRLLATIEARRSHVCVGLDPDLESLPPAFRDVVLRGVGESDVPGESSEGLSAALDDRGDRERVILADEEARRVAGAYREFLIPLMDALIDVAAAVKPQVAYFEALGEHGYALYREIVAAAVERGYVVIADAKRGDIGTTAEAYARAHLDVVGADAVTVNPWFGTDGLEPFLRRAREHGKGSFVLVKTSNPTSAEIQDRILVEGGPVYERVADLVKEWAAGSYGERGYASVGAVVGATHPRIAATLRDRLPGIPFLAPGYGAQGASATDLACAFDGRGTGCLVNSARAILYAYRRRPGHWVDAARAEAEEMRRALWEAAGR
jgi:orotidine-5'-phosphate decarboxylase